jgi:CheY-like chemotaxis protein
MSTATAPDARTKARILVVDDEPVIREHIGTILRDLGHEVLEAGNGHDALAAALADQPDLILLDILMPQMSGIEVCRQLRENPYTREIRVIVVSGLDARRALEESIIAGADDFLSKPIDPLELTVRVRSLLRVRNIHDENQRVEAYVRSLQNLRGREA